MAIVTPLDSPPGARRRLRLSSPVTREPLWDVEVTSPEEVSAALERARKAQPEWAALPPEGRARYLRRALEHLVDQQDAFLDVILRESGKARSEAIAMEIFAACDSLSYHARHTPRVLRPEKRSLHGLFRLAKRLRIEYRPLGVAGVISPWNGPFVLALNPTIQALMAGNAVLLKPSEVTARSGALVGELFEAARLPEGVLTVLPGDAETGAALVEAGVDKISFTGSVATGRRVAEACARKLIPCTLELGGKDAMIVCADAHLDRAAGGATAGAFLNTGQFCCGTERVYVVEEVADAFIERVAERTAALRQGAEGEFDVGALCWPQQLAIVERHVEDAVAKGARVLAGGRRNPDLAGLFYEPTVLVDVTHDMLVMQEETFGPVLPIMRVPDVESALRLANDSAYGLSSTVWTRDRHQALEVARRLETGSVCVNDICTTYGIQEAPFGGRKYSGLGQANGEAGVRGFCFPMPIVSDRSGGRQAARTYPYSTKRDARMQRLIRLLWGTPLGRWLGA